MYFEKSTPFFKKVKFIFEGDKERAPSENTCAKDGFLSKNPGNAEEDRVVRRRWSAPVRAGGERRCNRRRRYDKIIW